MNAASAPVVLSVLQARENNQLGGFICVVIDVLRASTTLLCLLENGAEAVQVVGTVPEARRLRQEGFILFGERRNDIIKGFDFDNSPLAASLGSWAGKKVALTTSNGTQAIVALRDAAEVIVACFRNANAVADYLRDRGQPVALVPVGSDGRQAIEDEFCAEAIRLRLVGDGVDWEAFRRQVLLLKRATMQRRGETYCRDVELALAANATSVVPFLSTGLVVRGHVPRVEWSRRSEVAKVYARPLLPYAAVGGMDGTLRLLRPTGSAQEIALARRNEVGHVAAVTNGAELLVASGPELLSWDLIGAPNPLGTLSTRVSCILVDAPDGVYVGTWSNVPREHTLFAYKRMPGRLGGPLWSVACGIVRSLCAIDTPHGRWLVVGSEDRSIRLVDIAGRVVCRRATANRVTKVMCTPARGSRTRLIVLGDASDVELVEVRAADIIPIASARLTGRPTSSFLWQSDDKDYLVVATASSVEVLTVDDDGVQPHEHMDTRGTRVRALYHWSTHHLERFLVERHDGSFAAYSWVRPGTVDALLRIISSEKQRASPALALSTKERVYSCQFSRSAQRLYAVTGDGEVVSASVETTNDGIRLGPPEIVFRAATPDRLRTLAIESRPSGHGEVLYFAGEAGTVYRCGDDRCGPLAPPLGEWIYDTAFWYPSRALLVLCQSALHVVDTASGSLTGSVPVPNAGLRCLCIDGASGRVFVGSDVGRVLEIGTIDAGRSAWRDLQPRCLFVAGESVRCIHVVDAPGRRMLLAGSEDGLVYAYDLETERLAWTHPFDRWVRGLAAVRLRETTVVAVVGRKREISLVLAEDGSLVETSRIGFEARAICALSVGDRHGLAISEIGSGLRVFEIQATPSGARLVKERPVRIFLSYTREDFRAVISLYRSLREAGYEPFMDKEGILPGEEWQTAIQRAIRSSDFFVACLSSSSVNRRGVFRTEIREALDIWKGMMPNDIFLIPVRLADCPLPEDLGRFQACDVFGGAGVERLVSAIEEGRRRREAKLPSSGQFPPPAGGDE